MGTVKQGKGTVIGDAGEYLVVGELLKSSNPSLKECLET